MLKRKETEVELCISLYIKHTYTQTPVHQKNMDKHLPIKRGFFRG